MRPRPLDRLPRPARILLALVAALAAALIALVSYRGWVHVSSAWDVWYYHLPFAARLVGLVSPEVVRFDALNEVRYQSFPRLAELLQGALWRGLGRPEAASLLGPITCVAVAAIARRVARIPMGALLVAWIAIPTAQIHMSVPYIDLPANACLTGLVLVVHRAFVERRPLPAGTLAAAIALGAVAANMKLMMAPLAALALLALGLRAAWLSPRRAAVLAVFAATSPIVLGTQLVNLARFGNPAYPVEVHVLGRTLPWVETPYTEVSPRFEPLPQPGRFAASLLELGLRDVGDPFRYTVDQWMPPHLDGNRMGGFLHVYVVAMLVLLAVLARGREGRVAAALFAALTAVVAVMPQSHVLRYYLVWMLTLTALVVMLGARALADRRWARGALACAIVPIAALAFTAKATRAWYLTPDSYRFGELVAERVDGKTLAAIPEGGSRCVDAQPWSFLYAAPFHPPRRYQVVLAPEAECPLDHGRTSTHPAAPSLGAPSSP